MSQYQSAFNDHPIHAAVKQARKQLADLPENVQESDQENAADALSA